MALVIDPCRDDRGFFQWTGNPSQRKRRTGGFYLTGSRFRLAELEFMAAQLEGKAAMAHDPRMGGYPGPFPAPVVNIAERNSAWQAPAIMAMMTLQFCVLALLAWKLLAPPDAETMAAQDEKLEVIEKRLDEMNALERAEAREIPERLDLAPRIPAKFCGKVQPEWTPRGWIEVPSDDLAHPGVEALAGRGAGHGPRGRRMSGCGQHDGRV